MNFFYTRNIWRSTDQAPGEIPGLDGAPASKAGRLCVQAQVWNIPTEVRVTEGRLREDKVYGKTPCQTPAKCSCCCSSRYKALCPATWPHWRGEPSDGVEVLAQHLGYLPNEYKMGRWGQRPVGSQLQKKKVSWFAFCCSNKIFIRHPRTLYATEDAFEKCKHELGEFFCFVCCCVPSLWLSHSNNV